MSLFRVHSIAISSQTSEGGDIGFSRLKGSLGKSLFVGKSHNKRRNPAHPCACRPIKVGYEAV